MNLTLKTHYIITREGFIGTYRKDEYEESSFTPNPMIASIDNY